MEKHRNTELREVCKKIYFVILTVIARRRFLKDKARIVQCQKFIKVCTGVYIYPKHIFFFFCVCTL